MTLHIQTYTWARTSRTPKVPRTPRTTTISTVAKPAWPAAHRLRAGRDTAGDLPGIGVIRTDVQRTIGTCRDDPRISGGQHCSRIRFLPAAVYR